MEDDQMITAIPHVLKVLEVARLLGVSRRTVYRWIAAGDLPAARLGPRQMRVTREDLFKFVEKHKE